MVDEGWQVWIGWYQARLEGTSPNLELDRDIALIDDKIWEAGPAVANAEVERLVDEHSSGKSGRRGAAADLQSLLEARDLRAALADFELDDLARLMRMVQFVDDVKDLEDSVLAQDRANRLSELRDLMADLARDIRDFASDNVPKYVARAATRYSNEAKLGVGEVRPGRLWDIGLELAAALKDQDVEFSFPDHLFQKLDHAVGKHRELMREYFASVLARMRPLDRIQVAEDASPKDAIEALVSAVDGLDGDWGDAPKPDPEIPAVLDDRVEELRDILDRIHRSTDEAKKAELERTFWRKAKAAAVTVLRYGLRVGLAAGFSVSTAAGLQTLFPAQFARAVELLQKILTGISWLA